jgi:DNA invertase Pin-like site-specific DNA recombinase
MVTRRKAAKRTTATTGLSGAIAIAYIRASKDEQKLTLEAQRTCIEAWAAREGVQVAAWHVDAGVCSVDAIEERPGLLAALAAIPVCKATVFVVAKRDRIARDVMLTAMIERGARKAGAEIVSAAGEGNGSTPADALMRTMLDGIAAYELALIRARTKAALATKKAKGERTGSCPFGMRLAADGKHVARAAGCPATCKGCLNLEKDPGEQATIARAKQLSDAGLTVRAIASQLAGEGHCNRAGKPLAFQAIGLFLRPLLESEAA